MAIDAVVFSPAACGASTTAESRTLRLNGSDLDLEQVLALTQEDVDVVSQLRSDIGAFAARTEHITPKVRVQHILISFSGAPRMPSTVTRTKEEAEALGFRHVVSGPLVRSSYHAWEVHDSDS